TLSVFNTNACLEYFQLPHQPNYSSNLDTSERVLQVLAISPIATRIFEQVSSKDPMSANYWHVPIFQPAWMSYMLYVGGLTFAEKSPEKQLQVPNLIAAQHFANAVLDHYGLHVSDITNALQKVVSTGDISELLGFYNRVMIKRDVGDDDLRNKLEEHHRDSFNYALLKNGLLQPNIEFESPITTGWIDLLIKTVTNRIIITEWKVLRINFIDIQPAILQPGMKKSVEFQKALTLSNISDITSVLQLRISSYDKFGRGGKTIREWILKQGPSDQLINYRASPEITELRKTYKAVAYLVVIVGSRKILLWQLSNNGKFLEEPLLSSW
ncbi:16103_t:CDS:2, partial [Entrophospora sp. SA101]